METYDEECGFVMWEDDDLDVGKKYIDYGVDLKELNVIIQIRSFLNSI